MADGCDECYLRRGEGVVCRDGDGEQPEAAGVGGRGRIARSLENGFPVEEVFFVNGAEVKTRFVGLLGEVADLGGDAFEGGGGRVGLAAGGWWGGA